MIWLILAVLGVPLWLCAVAVLAPVLRNRSLRQRPGDLPVRVLRPGKTLCGTVGPARTVAADSRRELMTK